MARLGAALDCQKGRYEQGFYGYHGGLTAEEMEIPLLSCAF